MLTLSGKRGCASSDPDCWSSEEYTTCPLIFMRAVIVLTLCSCMAACGSASVRDDYNEAVYQAQMRTTLDSAFACERDYVHANVQSPATNTEITDAAIAACNQPISAAVQAHMADVVIRREDTLTAAQVEHERAKARTEIVKQLRGDATQLLLEGRNPGKKMP